jgi:hypothetical protein
MKITKVVAIIVAAVLTIIIAGILLESLRFVHIGTLLPNNSASVPTDNGNIIPEAPSDPVVPRPIGGDKDAHGCLPAAGYTWCEQKQKCLREWEEKCFDRAGGGQVCTQEAKQCSDGSYVSRTLPGCQFAPCPEDKGQMCGGIAGIICPAGFTCKMSGDYPDASGTCVSSQK